MSVLSEGDRRVDFERYFFWVQFFRRGHPLRVLAACEGMKTSARRKNREGTYVTKKVVSDTGGKMSTLRCRHRTDLRDSIRSESKLGLKRKRTEEKTKRNNENREQEILKKYMNSVSGVEKEQWHRKNSTEGR